MSIRVRLILSYIAMLVIPFILSTIAFIWIVVANVSNAPGIEKLSVIAKSDGRIVKEGAALFEEIGKLVKDDPDKLKDKSYISAMDFKLNILNTGVIVKQDESLIFVSGMFDNIDIDSELKAVELSFRNEHDMPLIADKYLTIKRSHFKFSDGSSGAVYLLSDVSPIGKVAVSILSSFSKTVLIILILTNGILTFIVSRSIIKPLYALKQGAEYIKEGNLNFRLKNRRNDEIGELADAFEEMRRKLKESIEQQLQYENNRKELISNISHDLKTPITSIKGYVEGIKDGVADTPEKMERYIETIYTKANDMDKLVDELFLYSKLDLNRVPFNFEAVEIVDYMSDCMEELRFDLEKKNICLDLDLNVDKKIKISADREKLKRVINNIIGNSVKYMDKDNGRIKADITDNGDFITLKIEDNGKGISKEALPFIFDRFYRADPSRNTATGGSGLGLAIARKIIEEHGGRVWAESEENVGTSIYFTLNKIDVEGNI